MTLWKWIVGAFAVIGVAVTVHFVVENWVAILTSLAAIGILIWMLLEHNNRNNTRGGL